MDKGYEVLAQFKSVAGPECIIALIGWNNGMSWYCGYVIVPKDHPALTATDLKCHGGVTYTGSDYLFEKDRSLIGFDMAHYGDDRKSPKPTPELTAYVKAELESLAAQIVSFVSPDTELKKLKDSLWDFEGATLADEDWSDKLKPEAALHYLNARQYIGLARVSLEFARITNAKE